MLEKRLLNELQAAKHVAVLTGAGVSAESGIPTFRDALTGLWSQYDAEQLASEKGFRADPALVWGWYEWRRHKVMKAKPNAAHQAIAQLQQLVSKLSVITQNVDDLHERAGSQNVLHLHGSHHSARCICCELPHLLSTDTDVDEQQRMEPPRCSLCGDFVRPGVVWFGEQMPVKAWRDAEFAVKQCDLLIVVGTSGMVYPAATLPQTALYRGIPVVEVNANQTDLKANFNLRGPAGTILPQLVGAAFNKII